MLELVADVTGPYWYQAVLAGLNVVQTVLLAYVYSRWRRVNGELAALRLGERGDRRRLAPRRPRELE